MGAWQGHPQTHGVPGSYSATLRITVDSAVPVEFSVRTTTAAARCPWLGALGQVDVEDPVALQAFMDAAILKAANVRLESGPGVRLNLDGDADHYLSLDGDVIGKGLTFPARASAHSFWWWSPGGESVVQVELWWDVPSM